MLLLTRIVLILHVLQVEIKRVEMRDKNASNGQWGQNIMVRTSLDSSLICKTENCVL